MVSYLKNLGNKKCITSCMDFDDEFNY